MPSFSSLTPIVQAFLARHQATPTAACLCVAGPVLGGRARLTNLPWTLDQRQLADELGIGSVVLLNDLQAIAYAVPHLRPQDAEPLNAGTAVANGPIAVIAPGTGLGESFLIWDGHRYQACASEGGHTDFGPVNDQQAGLLAFMSRRVGRVSYERVCAGSGLPNVYEYLRTRFPAQDTEALAASLVDVDDPTPLIVAAALAGPPPDPVALAAVSMMIDIWAAEAGNLALKTLSTGGVYLAGGMPMRVGSALNRERFMQVFSDKGPFSGLLRSMPVHRVLVNAGLLGAARFGLQSLD